MKINWKVRFQNKVWLLAFLTCILTFVYQITVLCGIQLPFSEYEATRIVTAFVEFLGLIGIVIDPTSKGVSDSPRALTYCTEDDVREYGV